MTVDWCNVSLLGIDVGYSASRATTGLASYRYGKDLHVRCVRFDPSERRAALADGPIYNAVAIDGPLVAAAFEGPRGCERVLSRGLFGKRCKAGYSHFGEGAKLRAAARLIASENFHLRAPRAPIVEAFPNAFLGVMLDDAAFAALPSPLPRGRKSDLFFARALADGCFERLLTHLGWRDERLLDGISIWAHGTSRAAHDVRAAIVCVLTAGCALAEETVRVGDAAGGHICLPPPVLWAPWAQDALSVSASA